MDLKTFVAESLKQIAEGIKEAQAANTGAWINPKVILQGDRGTPTIGGISTHAYAPQSITFDIAVTATGEGSEKTGGGLRVLGFSLLGETNSVQQNSAISRIQFEIPVSWPLGKDPRE
jgi:hypothetical protein